MKTETEHLIATLRTVMQVLGIRKSHIEKKMGWPVSYLSKIFSGKSSLRYQHVVDISRAIGLKPQELLRFAYPQWGEPPSEAGRRAQEILASLLPSTRDPAPPPQKQIDEKDVERMVLKVMRQLIPPPEP